MKKFLILLSLIIPAITFVSCSDKDDLPDVNIDVTFENATMSDGTLYVVQGQDFTVSGITVTNNESNKPAGLTGVNYYWDYVYVGSSVQPPYVFEFEISQSMPVGKHLLEIDGTVLAIDKTPAFTIVSIPVVVVESETDLPEATAPATLSTVAKVTKTSK